VVYACKNEDKVTKFGTHDGIKVTAKVVWLKSDVMSYQFGMPSSVWLILSGD